MKLQFLSKWAEIAFHHFDIKCLAHEIYPVIEIEMAATKDDQVKELLWLLTAREMHDSAVLHVDRWRNLNKIELLDNLIPSDDAVKPLLFKCHFRILAALQYRAS